MTPLDQVPLYYKGHRLEIRPLLPEKIGTLLDVGCGAGGFGWLIRGDYGAEVWGIEYVPDMAKLAEERLDRVFAGDCMAVLPTLPEAKFDVVTYTDVLEHLPEPQDALELTKRTLAPGGVVVASVPNIRYWPALRRVIGGDFPREDQGIFDRTHLRFFTKRSLVRMFEENGWEVLEVVGLNPLSDRNLRALNILTLRKFQDMVYLQFGVRARLRKEVAGPQ